MTGSVVSPAVLERPALHSVLRACAGPVDDQICQVLSLLVEELGMHVAFLGQFRDGARVITHSTDRGGGQGVPVGTAHPTEETLCHLFATELAGQGVADAQAHPILARHPHTAAYHVGAYAGIPVRVAGEIIGVLCCAAGEAVPDFRPRDLATLATVANHVGELLAHRIAGVPDASGSDGGELRRLVDAVDSGHDLERLTRPLLALLQEATGLESTYLTAVDWPADEQRILYSLNTAKMEIPEGLTVEWADTLCRRSLEEGRLCTTDVPTVWGDSRAATDLGIHTYISVPVLDEAATVVGTLCGASSSAVEVDPQHLATMRLFATLIGQQLSAEASAVAQKRRASELEARLHDAHDQARRDHLTGLRNRSGIERWLEAVAADFRVGQEQIAVGFCDLDGFKQVNDTYGHHVGDEVLRRFAAGLTTVGRAGDLHGRLGGDEFVVAAVLPASPAALGSWSARLRAAARCRLADPSAPGGPLDLDVRASLGVVAFAEPVAPSEVLTAADRAMYEDKQSRPG